MCPLLQLLERWRDHTVEESAAIDNLRFSDLALIQAKKRALKIEITELSPRSTQVNGLRFSSHYVKGSPTEPSITTIVQEILVLEKLNSRKLTAGMDHVNAHRLKLKQAGSNLKRIRNAYSTQLRPEWRYLS